MHILRKVKGIAVPVLVLLSLAACNDPDERKTHYVTIVRSQDVEIREEFVDTDMKKPTVVVHHPDGVDVRHLPTKPRKTVSFVPVDAEFLTALILLLLLLMSHQTLLANSRQREKVQQAA